MAADLRQEIESGGDAAAELIATNGGEGARREPRRYAVPALEKGLTILELLSREEQGLTQTEIAARMGRSINEIFRMIVCLRDLGYVVLLPDDRYALTLKLFELSHRHPPMKRLIDKALPIMSDLARALEQSCHLTVYHDGRQVVVAQVDNPGGMGFGVRMGAQIDLLMSASGRVLTAFQQDSVRERMIEEYKGEARDLDIEEILLSLSMVRQLGYAEMDSVQVRGVRGMSFPVRDRDGHAAAALVIPFLERLDSPGGVKPAEARRALGEAAARLSAAIGGVYVSVSAPP